MQFTPASPASLAAFDAIVVVVLAAVLLGVHRAWPGHNRIQAVFVTAGVLLAWLGTLSALVVRGRMETLPLHGLPAFFAPIVLIGAGVGLSPVGRRLAGNLPLAALVGFQIFRLPLELVLHQWAAQGVIPETMTWTGQNWDVVSGLLAVACAPVANENRAAAWAANLIGFALLLNVMRVALFSSPLPFGWGQQPPLLLAWHLPYAFIGPVCVGGALFGHVVLTRALLTERSPQPSS